MFSRNNIASGPSAQQAPNFSAGSQPILGPTIAAFVTKRMLQLLGIGLLGSSLLLGAAVTSFNPGDPSLNVATDQPATNLLGGIGATIADLAMQTFGIASLLLVIVPTFWAFALLRTHPIPHAARRLGWLTLACILSGLSLALWSGNENTASTPIGGGIAQLLVHAFTDGSPPQSLWRIGVALFASALSVLTISLAMSRDPLLEVGTPALNFLAKWIGVDIEAMRVWKKRARGDAKVSVIRTDSGSESGSIKLLEYRPLAGASQILLAAPSIAKAFFTHRAAKAVPSRASELSQSRAKPERIVENEPDEGLVATFKRGMAAVWKSGDAEGDQPSQVANDTGAHQRRSYAPSDAEITYPDEVSAANQTSPASAAADIGQQDFADDFADEEDLPISHATSNTARSFKQPSATSATSATSTTSAASAPRSAKPAPANTPQAATKRPSAEPAPRMAPRAARNDGSFQLPTTDLLQYRPGASASAADEEYSARRSQELEVVLSDFGVRGNVVDQRSGPVVTLHELEPAPGVKSSRVISLAEDIARSMSAISARVAVIPGRNAIGIELPNPARQTVYLRELLDSAKFSDNECHLPMALGSTIGGEAVVADLARMPHLLIAGTTGSGKSVGINAMILSLLYRHQPETCRMIMIDPKMLELSVYEGIPHLLSPVVTDPKKAVMALKWTVMEMEQRYQKMSKIGVRNIHGYNEKVREALANGESMSRRVQTGFDPESGTPIFEHEELDATLMPFLVVIIDEMADLMVVAGKEIESLVQRLAQMARASGIHLITATQRPSVDVITGTIKANFPTRVSYQVTSKIDSRTILGEQGAEQLLGQGDMLLMVGGGRLTRVHGPFVSDNEVETIVDHLKAQGQPVYASEISRIMDEEKHDAVSTSGASMDLFGGGDDNDENGLYQQAVAIVLRDKKCSISYVQRRLSIGYNRAARLIERMEDEGVISAPSHAGKREILAKTD